MQEEGDGGNVKTYTRKRKGRLQHLRPLKLFIGFSVCREVDASDKAGMCIYSYTTTK